MLDGDAIRARGFRLVVDYGYSSASHVLPLLLGRLGVEAITAHPFEAERGAAADAARDDRRRRGGSSARSAPSSASSSTAPPSGCT